LQRFCTVAAVQQTVLRLDNRRMSSRHRGFAIALIVLTLAGTAGELCLGAVAIPLPTVLAALTHPLAGAGGDPLAAIVLDLRLPRLLLALAAGAALAQAGAAMQALYRNPLAEPGLAGVSGGSALAAAAVFALTTASAASAWTPFLLPLAAFAGGSVAALLITRLSRYGGQTQTGALLLGGLAINAIAGAGIGWISLHVDSDALRNYLAWAYGDLGRTAWPQLTLTLPLLLIAIIGTLREARRLDALLLGEAEAAHLGVPVEMLKRRLLLFAVLAAAGTAAAAGPIGFVGLIAPHLARMLFGALHRRLLPLAALAGAALLSVSDLIARVAAQPTELPVGVLTALLGGPFFLALLAARRRFEDEP
jgi:iron complex transport system permease protein